MYDIRVFPLSNSGYTSQVYAGLYELEFAGKAKVRLTAFPRFRVRERNGAYFSATNNHILWIEVTEPTRPQPCKICIDFMDGNGISSLDGLVHADVYFKRSYDRKHLDSLAPELAKKVLPYGLNYCCRSSHERSLLTRDIIYKTYTRQFSRQDVKEIARLLYDKFDGTRERSDWLFDFTDFEIPPTVPAQRQVLFQTRVFDHTPRADAGDTHAMNEHRAATIRALKQELGGNFLGGLIPDTYARTHYPDCLSNFPHDKRNYLQAIRNSLIAVTTTGLVGSTGWKLPEYLAASRCIVTEPLVYSLPVQLVAGENYLEFTSSTQCVAECVKLLEDRELARQMRERNWSYYVTQVRPSSLVENFLKTALEHSTSGATTAPCVSRAGE